jgi:hypothetical protein
MPTIDLSRLSAADYPELALRWKQTAKTPYCGGRINPNGSLTLGAETETISIEFCLTSDTGAQIPGHRKHGVRPPSFPWHGDEPMRLG